MSQKNNKPLPVTATDTDDSDNFSSNINPVNNYNPMTKNRSYVKALLMEQSRRGILLRKTIWVLIMTTALGLIGYLLWQFLGYHCNQKLPSVANTNTTTTPATTSH